MSEHSKQPLTKATKLIASVVLLLALVVAASVIFLASYGSDQKGQKEVAQAGQVQEQDKKKDLAEEVKKVCDAGGVPAQNLRQRGLCGKVTEIIKEGPSGPPGETGEQGLRGPKGDKGDKGDPGATPPCLLQANRCVGATGGIGAAGPIGPQGPKGDQGLKGEKGDSVTGPVGPEGPKGDTGDKGDRGDPCSPSIPECRGPAGPKGDTGDKGDPGTPAFPFTFKFTVPGTLPNDPGTTYTCVVENSTTPAACVQS